MSHHSSKIAYWRLDHKRQEEFVFIGASNGATSLIFDGRNLTCIGKAGYTHECNELTEGQSVPVVIFSLAFNPRDGGFRNSNEEDKWARNKYSLQGSYYKLKCQGMLVISVREPFLQTHASDSVFFLN